MGVPVEVLNREADTADASSCSVATSLHCRAASTFTGDVRIHDDWFSNAFLVLIPVCMMAGAILGTYLGVIFANSVRTGLLD